MKSWLLAVAVLLGLAVGPAGAQYLLIKIDLNKFNRQTQGPNAQGGPAGAPMFPGGGPRGGGPQAGPGAPGGADTEEEPPLWATAHLELKKAPTQVQLGVFSIDHPWGKGLIMPQQAGEGSEIKLYSDTNRTMRFAKRMKDLGKNRTPDNLLNLAGWALRRGLTAQFLQLIDEVAKAEPNHPVVKAVQQVQADMKRPVSTEDPAAAALLAEFKGGFRPETSDEGHYVLYTDLKPGRETEADVRQRLARLESTYQSFFYWFALQKKVLPVPTHRLVAVLVENPDAYTARRESLDPSPPVADGFLARRHNVAVFSYLPAEEAKEAYDKLEKMNKADWGLLKVARPELLLGTVVNKHRNLATQPAILARIQTLALLQKAMEEESERASVTHEGTRQLLAATGLVPRNVVAGHWVQFGMASFFEAPFGAYYPTVGLPSWQYFLEFTELKKSGELADSQEALLKTITDSYFVAAHATHQQKESIRDEALAPVLHEELRVARASAWALTYWLANNKDKLPGLERYFKELASLPRDLEFDRSVLEGCFARAFGLVDPGDPNKLDPEKAAALAADWYRDMEREGLDLIEVQRDATAARSKDRKTHPRNPRPRNPRPNNPNAGPRPGIGPQNPRGGNPNPGGMQPRPGTGRPGGGRPGGG